MTNLVKFFKSPLFAIIAAALGGALPLVASNYPQLGSVVALVSMLLHGVTTQFAKNAPGAQ